MVEPFKWDKNFMGAGIEVSLNGQALFLRESAYMFRSIVADKVRFPNLGFLFRGSLLGNRGR